MLGRFLLVAVVAGWFLVPPVMSADAMFDSNGVKIHYLTAGQGEPIVLLHGWMSDSSMWGSLDTNPMAKEFQLIAMDFRGHGKSDKPHQPEQYGPDMAEDVVRLLDYLKLPKAHLVGYSMGAIVAGKVAGTHPDRVISIVYGGQAPILTGAAKRDAREIDVFAKAVEAGNGLGPYLEDVWPANKPKITPKQADALAKLLYRGKDVVAFAAAGRGIKHLDVTPDQLKRCKVPTLLIHGSQEAESTQKRVAAILKFLDRGELHVIDGTDHVTTLAAPEFGKTIDRFLRANQQKPADR
ncbi:alpha/beta fold hydrolase [Tuwongella immobilis]|uniref:AB hydrolase-1 domain-containing protein n=1 Tax=Tuwongella immobilis TaxID=692036 RepID=A0A6C2YWA0_9BACT|nr:alpha/beta hydrolase [Tuwongella immobilis]VIP05142.1 Hydrolase OS=Fimbriimonas ginsengisoli Gsoil 348 GN=OP10G_3973 PE=4 SV=1: Abhydrolase_6 [Tuwongella immobilis]VTS07640.1 Hydrolase OS=Fimbriimonas ginsengisoli Gsoil 348 GN=OP10G_3973 PE=4 SV=1: Abhydrolase_6 [Tuwongella immobilis]